VCAVDRDGRTDRRAGALGVFFGVPDLQHAVRGWRRPPWSCSWRRSRSAWDRCSGLMISEIFPLSLRSKAMAVCTAANWIANFVVSYFFLQLIGEAEDPASS
jgi:hypothetical protein